jgi:hypothetical protein
MLQRSKKGSKEKYGRKLKMRHCRKTELYRDVWLLDDPPKADTS